MTTWVGFERLAEQYRVKRGVLDHWVQENRVRMITMGTRIAPNLPPTLHWANYGPVTDVLPEDPGEWYALEDVVPLVEIDMIADAEARLDPDGLGTFGTDRPTVKRPGPQLHPAFRRTITAGRKR